MKFKFPRIKLRKKNSPLNYPTNFSSANYTTQDWDSFFATNSRKNSYAAFNNKRKKTRWNNLYRAAAAFAVFLVVLTLKETDHPLGVQARETLKYALTTDWDYQPILDKAVALGLQTVNMDVPFFNELPGTTPVLAPNTENYYALPVSGKMIKNYGWLKEGADELERFNPGIYIAADAGTEVKAARSGRVARVGEDSTLGTYVLIEHSGEDYTLYAGLGDVYVNENDKVETEAVIGTVGEGADGISGLHFEIREDNKLVDPVTKLEGLTK